MTWQQSLYRKFRKQGFSVEDARMYTEKVADAKRRADEKLFIREQKIPFFLSRESVS